MTNHTFQEATCYTVENTQSTVVTKCEYGPVGQLSPWTWASYAIMTFMIGYMLFRIGKIVFLIFRNAFKTTKAQATATSAPTDNQE